MPARQPPSRRRFLEQTVAATSLAAGVAARRVAAPRAGPPGPPPASFLDILRPPDAVVAQTDAAFLTLGATGAARWEGGGIVVTTDPGAAALAVGLEAPGVPVRRLHLRWRGDLSATRLLLGDAWERGYGDLEWRGFVPDRAMPWYCALWNGRLAHGYGVRTGPAAFCFWQADRDGLSLWADVRSGGVPLQLGGRRLDVCDMVCRPGRPGESAFAAVHMLCRLMCPAPRLPARPVYGHNDWYAAYGDTSEASALADAARIVELSPAGDNRPFAVLDDGWQPGRSPSQPLPGVWDRGNEKFPDMPGLAARIRGAGARPGIWMRPLELPADAPAAWTIPRQGAMLDPTVPEVRHKVAADVARLAQWGFDLIKHDYSTYDIFGRWGFQMGTALTREGWTFGEGAGRTTAEVIGELYDTIRAAAGEALIIGCNTVSHLSAGRFEMCRIGDDTSGTEWARTRRMGVNSLAFRGAQHGAFYVADPDCVGVTAAVPWQLNRQWLDLLSRSGTMTFVSVAAAALTDAVRRDLRAALALAATPQPLGEPLDWQAGVWPRRWKLRGREVDYDWIGPEGVDAP